MDPALPQLQIPPMPQRAAPGPLTPTPLQGPPAPGRPRPGHDDGASSECGSIDSPLSAPSSASVFSSTHSPLLSSPRSNFEFSWVPEHHFSRSPTAPRSSRSSSSGSSTVGAGPGLAYGYGSYGRGARLQHHQHHRRSAGLGVVAASVTTPRATPVSVPPCLVTSVPNSVRKSSPTAATVDITSQPSTRLGAGSISSPSGSTSAPSGSAVSSPTDISPRSTKPASNMPPARPSKRSADGGSTSEEDGSVSGAAKMKLARSDRGPEDFSSVVKNRLQSYTRTGQACDRCKVRKIRCDALPEGCSHCINLNLECYVTDRVTGRTERRGYMQELEREKSSMRSRIIDLERLCAERGVKIRPGNEPDIDEVTETETAENSTKPEQKWARYGCLWIKEKFDAPSAQQLADTGLMDKLLRNQWPSRPDEAYWGVGPDNAPLSSIGGTKLTLLGTSIETTSFNAPDVDEPLSHVGSSTPLYNKSVQAFLRSIMRVNPPIQIEMPTRENAFMYAEWYFLSIASFLPLLHKPTFMKLLARVYDDPDYKASAPEQVLFHMVFAIIMFQFSSRNNENVEQRNHFNEMSNRHYHFSLSKMYDLLSCQDFIAVQALALIACHTRGFPKPGCGSLVANMALNKALELKLHRRWKQPGQQTDLHNELRKRAWWVILMITVALNARRGYPVTLSVQDFDVDFPEPIADELLSEEGVDTSRTLPCPYDVALSCFTSVPPSMEMYAHLYSARRNVGNYKEVVSALEAQMKKWEAQLPESMRLDSRNPQDHEITGALYTRTLLLEFRLHSRHPSLAMTTDKDMIAENTRICEESSREYLTLIERLTKMRALDTTWYQVSTYCVAILCMLIPQWTRRFDISSKEIATLKEEMDRWMAIIKEMSSLMGSGEHLTNQVAELIDRTMASIKRDSKNPKKSPVKREQSSSSTPALPPPQEPQLKPERQQQLHQQQQQQEQKLPNQLNHAHAYAAETGQSPAGNELPMENQDKAYYQSNNPNAAPTSYPQLAYVDHHHTAQNPPSSASYQHEPAGMYYATTAGADNVQSNSLAHYAPPEHHQGQQSPEMMWRHSWRQSWTAAMADNQDRFSANALLALGGNANTGGANSGHGRNASQDTAMTPLMTDHGLAIHAPGGMPMVPQPAQWPLIMFDPATEE